MDRLKLREIKVRPRIYYDKHRRITRRITIGGGYLHGCWLPEIKRTWGQIFIAKREGAKLAALFDKS